MVDGCHVTFQRSDMKRSEREICFCLIHCAFEGMTSRKRMSAKNSSLAEVTRIERKNEPIYFTIGIMLASVTIVVIFLAVGAQYVYFNYYYLPNQISAKSELPTVSPKSDQVCFC